MLIVAKDDIRAMIFARVAIRQDFMPRLRAQRSRRQQSFSPRRAHHFADFVAFAMLLVAPAVAADDVVANAFARCSRLPPPPACRLMSMDISPTKRDILPVFDAAAMPSCVIRATYACRHLFR